MYGLFLFTPMSKLFGFSWSDFFYSQQGANHVYTLSDPKLGDLLSVFSGGYSEANMMKLVQVMPEFMFAVNAVAGRMKGGIFSLQDKDGNEVTDNKLWNKIKDIGPNWQYSLSEFIWHAVAHRLVTGNRYGYSYCAGATIGTKPKHSNIEAIWLIPPHYTDVVIKNPCPSYLTTLSAKEYIERYDYTGGENVVTKISPEYITHDIYMKMGDATDIVRGKGISPFRAGEYPLSNLTAVYAARNVIYVKRGPLGAIVSAATDSNGSVALTPDEKTEVVNDLMARHGFGRNQSPLAVTNQSVRYEKFGSTISELEPFKETEASAAALCGIIGIPVSLMPKNGEAKFANLDIAERNLYENVIYPESESLCDFLTKAGHFNEIGCKVVVSYDHVSCLQDDALKFAQASKTQAEASTILWNGGHITQNELRQDCGKEPIDGGDVYVSEWRIVNVEPSADPLLTPEPPTEGDKAKKGVIKLYGKKFKRSKKNYYSHVATT